MRSIHYPNGTLNYFHYDSSLRRYALEDSNGLRYFTWDSNGTDLLAERNAEGEVVANYTHGYTPIDGIGSIVAAEKTVGSVTYYQYPIYDHRGTVMRIVDEDGEVCGDFEYSAWGKPLHEEVNGAETRFRYQSNWICLDDDSAGRICCYLLLGFIMADWEGFCREIPLALWMDGICIMLFREILHYF